MSSRENLSPQIIQRISKEIRKLAANPPEGIQFIPNEEDSLVEIYAEIRGPEGTPYDGGYFKVKLVLGDGFPVSPPKGFFLTKIFHPNISSNGDICVNTLKRDWTPELGIVHVLQVIRCLLIVPFPESSLNDEAGRLFMDSYDEYARRAKLYTGVHAPKMSLLGGSTEEKKPEMCTSTSNQVPNELSDINTKRVPGTSVSKETSISKRQRAVKKKGLRRL